MRYFLSIITVVIMVLLVKSLYIAYSENFYIAFIGGGITMLIFGFIISRGDREPKGKTKVRKSNIIFILVMIAINLLLLNNSFKYKLANIYGNIRFQVITANMEKEKYHNITYCYTGKINETYINKINDYIKEGEAKDQQIFGKVNAYPLNIVMYATAESFGKAFNVNPNISRAVTLLNTIYLPSGNINPHVIVHEYTHYKMNSFCIDKKIQYDKIPSWFQEGVAEYASAYLEPGLYKNTKLEKIENFKNLDTGNKMISYQSEGYNTYFQSYFAINKMVELKGKGAIKDILINTKSMEFYDAFKKVIGINIDDFQNLLK